MELPGTCFCSHCGHEVTNKVAAAKRSRTRTDLMAAYGAYQRREPSSMDNLLAAVRGFAYMKLYHLEHDFKDFGSAETVDDWAQDVTIAVWQELKKGGFEGTPENFYSWVHKIAFNKGNGTFNKLDEERSTKVPLFIKGGEDGDQEGDTYDEENPALYQESGVDHSLRIPASVQGIDLKICNWLMTTVRDTDDGPYRARNYAEVGRILGLKEANVKKRMERLRDRLKPEREAERLRLQKASEDAEKERRDSVLIGLSKIRGARG